MKQEEWDACNNAYNKRFAQMNPGYDKTQQIRFPSFKDGWEAAANVYAARLMVTAGALQAISDSYNVRDAHPAHHMLRVLKLADDALKLIGGGEGER